MGRTWKFTTHPFNPITTDDILKWANEWSSEERKGIVPKFELYNPREDQNDSDIRLKCVCK